MHDHIALSDIPVGSRAVIGAHSLDTATAQRLSELGMRPGASVTVVQKTSGGGRVIRIGSSRYALGAQALRSITVDAA